MQNAGDRMLCFWRVYIFEMGGFLPWFVSLIGVTSLLTGIFLGSRKEKDKGEM